MTCTWQMVNQDIMYNGNVWNMARHWEGERGSRLGIKQMNVQKSGPNECFFHSLSYNHLCPVNSTAWIDCVRINQYHLKSVLKLMGPLTCSKLYIIYSNSLPASYPDVLWTPPPPFPPLPRGSRGSAIHVFLVGTIWYKISSLLGKWK